MKKNKKLFAILTLVAFMMSLVPALAFAEDAPTINKAGGTATGVVLSITNAPQSATYQWTQDGSDITSATTNTYTATTVGEYTVKITTGTDPDTTMVETAAVEVTNEDLDEYNNVGVGLDDSSRPGCISFCNIQRCFDLF